MKTQFTSSRLDVNGLYFFFDGNSKITCGNGTFDQPGANSFSLPHVSDCPYSTPTCEANCYVHRLEAAESVLYKKYQHNSHEIRQVLDRLSSRMSPYPLAVYFAGYINKNCRDGFRWHVSGDVFSERYAEFIVDVCKRSRAVRHWIYTRSFAFAPTLSAARNLTLNLSADRDNYPEALRTYATYGGRICYMLGADEPIPEDLPPGSVIFPTYNARGRELATPTDHPWWQSLSLYHRKMVCPADFFGQSETRRCGPCDKCLVKGT